MYPVALRDEIRTWVLIQGKSQRAAARHFGLSRNTVAKLLEEEPAPKERRYQRQKVTPKTPVHDVVLPHIEGWLKENEWLQRWAPKQCWTAHRMWVELRKLGIAIGESTVRLFVQELRKPMKPTYVPLDFAPGERAEFDFGEAIVKLGGQLVKVPFLAGRLRFSGHDVFLHFHSVYRFEALFANVQAGWEKGSVENLVGYARRNYLVPLPEGTDLELINADLRSNCLTDQQRIMAGRTDPIAARLEMERTYLGPLPAHPPELGPMVEVLVHSTGRVRFQTNDYSVPIQYAYQRLTLKADPFRVCLFDASELVADHPRCYQQRQVIEDWRHYVSLLLKKSFAVPWASALRHGDLPPTFEAARLELVAQRADGNREFARLLELSDVPVPPLDPSQYPDYQGMTPAPDLSAYNRLLEVQP